MIAEQTRAIERDTGRRSRSRRRRRFWPGLVPGTVIYTIRVVADQRATGVGWGGAQRSTHTQLEENTQGFNYREREKWSLQIITEKFCSRRKQASKTNFFKIVLWKRKRKREERSRIRWNLSKPEEPLKLLFSLGMNALGCGEDRVHE